jgi:hypothetical protein
VAESGGKVTPGITEPFAAVIAGAVAAEAPLLATVVAVIAGLEVGVPVFVVAGFVVSEFSGIGAAVGEGSSTEPVTEADEPSAVLGVAAIDVAIGGEVGSGAWSLLEEHEPAKLPASTTATSDLYELRRPEFMRTTEHFDKSTYRSTRERAESAIEANSCSAPALRNPETGQGPNGHSRGENAHQFHNCAPA